MYTLKIKITKEILAASVNCQSDPTKCAFARAVIDILPHANLSTYYVYPFSLDDECSGGRFHSSNEMVRFIQTFDKTRSEDIPNIPEQEFDLPIPDWVINQINIDEIKPLLVNHPTLELINS